MNADFTLQKRVELSETDTVGLLHFSNYFRFMEMTEHAFLRSLGIAVITDDLESRKGWPKVHAECDYRHAVGFEDVLEISLSVSKRTTRSVEYAFRFQKINITPPVEVATGKLIVAYVQWEPRENRLQAIPIPDEIVAKIKAIAD